MLILFVTERGCVGGGADYVAAARQYHPTECDCTEHTGVCRLDRVNYIIHLISIYSPSLKVNVIRSSIGI